MADRDSAQWVLAFDGLCHTCTTMARQVELIADGRLTVKSLHSRQVIAWREQALGENPPRIPTLLAVNDANVRAWTHLAMGWRLARLVGPRKVWQISNILAEIGRPRAAAYDPGRRRFVKALGGAAVALSILSGAKLFSPEVARGASSGGQTSGLPPFAYQVTRQGELRGTGLATSQARALIATVRGSARCRGVAAQLPAGFALDTQAAVVSIGDSALLTAPVLHNGQDGGGGMSVVIDRRSGAVLEALGYVAEDVGGNKHVRVFNGTTQMADLTLDGEGIVARGWALQPDGTRATLANRDLTAIGRAQQAAFLQALRDHIAQPSGAVVTAYSGGNFWGGMNSCLSGMGVPSWIIGVLGVTCSIICIGTAGVGCIGCLAGAGFGYAAELSACIGWCICEINYSCP